MALPSEVMWFISEKSLKKTYELIALSIRNNQVYLNPEVFLERFEHFLERIVVFDHAWKIISTKPDFNKIDSLVDKLIDYTLFQSKSQPETLNRNNPLDLIQDQPNSYEKIDIIPSYFLPFETRGSEKRSTFYGTHHFFYLLSYFYAIYLKINMSYKIAPIDISSTAFEDFIELTKAVIVDHIDEVKYMHALYNLYGSDAKFIFHIKYLISQLNKVLLAFVNDETVEKIFDFQKTGLEADQYEEISHLIHERNPESTDIRNSVFRYYFNQDSKFLFISLKKPEKKIEIIQIDEDSDSLQETTEQNISTKSKKVNSKHKISTEDLEHNEPDLLKKVQHE